MVKTINMMGVEIIIPDDMNFACYGKTIELFASEKKEELPKEEPKAIVHHKKIEDVEVLPPEQHHYNYKQDHRLPRNMDALVLRVMSRFKGGVSQIRITKNTIPQEKRKEYGPVVKRHLNSMVDRGLLQTENEGRFVTYQTIPGRKV